MNDQKSSRLSDKLLRTAEHRLDSIEDRTEADLRRATSDLYYAIFHRICECLVEPMGAPAEPNRKEFQDLFRTIYRLPDHSFTSKKCKEIATHEFCREVKAIARLFTTLKSKREMADYDPLQQFAKSQVENDIRAVKKAMTALDAVPAQELTRFAYYVSLRGSRKIDID